MPELPDVVVYVEALEKRLKGKPLRRIRLGSPFVLRSVSPSAAEIEGRAVTALHRLGKRIVLELEGERFIVIHLMIAGRLLFREPGAKLPGRRGLAAFDFDDGTLLLTEAGSKKRASIHLVAGREGLDEHRRGGIEPLECDAAAFIARLRDENRTLKRALTDPHLVSGIGNAYSDEILHRARLSPFKRTGRCSDEELQRLWAATRETLEAWLKRLREEAGDGFPAKVTAFRPEMAVHGRAGEPCPVCGDPVQKIVYAQNEANYCATCQTGGKLLADRALSRLLKGDWPKSLEELEARRERLRE